MPLPTLQKTWIFQAYGISYLPQVTVTHNAADACTNGANRTWSFPAAAFVAGDVGKIIKIQGATNAGNNGEHVIAQVNSATTITTGTSTTPVTENPLAASTTQYNVQYFSVNPIVSATVPTAGQLTVKNLFGYSAAYGVGRYLALGGFPQRTPFVSAGSDTATGGTKTFVIATAGFQQADVGKVLRVNGAVNVANNADFTIASVTNSTTVVVNETPITEIFGANVTFVVMNGLNGIWKISKFNSATSVDIVCPAPAPLNRNFTRTSLTDAVVGATRTWTFATSGTNLFSVQDIGKVMRIAGAVNAANNADHIIVNVVSSSSVVTSSATTPVNETFGTGLSAPTVVLADAVGGKWSDYGIQQGALGSGGTGPQAIAGGVPGTTLRITNLANMTAAAVGHTLFLSGFVTTATLNCTGNDATINNTLTGGFVIAAVVNSTTVDITTTIVPGALPESGTAWSERYQTTNIAVGAGVSVVTDGRALGFAWKNMFKGFVNLGWQLVASCDGAPAVAVSTIFTSGFTLPQDMQFGGDYVDRLDTVTKVQNNSNTSETQSHTWYIFKNTNIGPNFQIVVSLTSNSAGTSAPQGNVFMPKHQGAGVGRAECAIGGLVRTGGNLVTVTTLTPHCFVAGSVTLVTGEANFVSGSKAITVTGTFTFTYSEAGSNASSTATQSFVTLSANTVLGTNTGTPLAADTGGNHINATDDNVKGNVVTDLQVIWGGWNAGFFAKLNGQISSDGQCTRHWIYSGGFPTNIAVIDMIQNPVANINVGPIVPHIANWATAVSTTPSNGCGGLSTSGSGSTLNTGSWFTAARFTGRINANGGAPPGSYTQLNMTLESIGSGATGQWAIPLASNVASELTLEYPMAPMALHSATVSIRGRVGQVFDLWATNPLLLEGDTFPATGTLRQFVVVGELVFPWDQSAVQIS